MHFEIENAAVQGRNIPLTSILTMGECWHNNHHAYPGSARLGLFAGEWDPGWWMLLLLHRLGLAWNFRLPKDLPARAELRAKDRLGVSQMSGPRYDPGDPRFAYPSFLRLWQALAVSRPDVGTVPQALRLEWPAATLGAKSMRCIVGQKVELDIDTTLDLLVLHQDSIRFVGLPAVCLAFAQRNRLAWALAHLILPVAAALESIRQYFALVEVRHAR